MATSTVTNDPSSLFVPYLGSAAQSLQNVATQPYQPYTGQLNAGTSPLEGQAYNAAGNYQLSPYFGQAAGAMQQGISGLLNSTNYRPNQIGSSYTASGGPSTYQAQNFNGSFNPTTFSSGYSAGQIGNTYNPTQFNAGYSGPGNAYSGFGNYQAGNIGSTYQANQTEGGIFDSAAAQQYMSPYQQGVTDIAKREANRDFDKQQAQLRARMGAAGAFGGSRATLLETENQRNQNQLLSDLQTRGLQDAYTNAQQMFGADRAARLQAFGLNEGARQTESQMGMQAQQANEAARLAGANLGLNATQANQQALQQAGQMGLQAQELGDASRRYADQSQLSRFQANEAARQQSGQMTLDAQRLSDASRQFGAGFGLESYQANQAAKQQQGAQNLQNYQAVENARQAQAQLGLDAQRASEANRLAAAQFGQQGYQAALSGAQGLAGIAANLDQAERARIAQMGELGLQQRQQQQAGLDAAYRQYLDERQYGLDRATTYASGIGNLAGRYGTTTTQAADPSTLNTILGAALTGSSILGELGGDQGAAGGLTFLKDFFSDLNPFS